MSHVAETGLVVHDLQCLELACKKLGIQFVHGQTTWEWFGQWMDDYSQSDAAYKHGIKPEMYGHSIHAIKVPGTNYEIGVMKNPNGEGFVLVYDFFGEGQVIVNKLGKGLQQIKREYSVYRHKKTAKADGRVVTEKRLQNGKIALLARHR